MNADSRNFYEKVAPNVGLFFAQISNREFGKNRISVKLMRRGVQRAKPFVQGYRECNFPVQVKGGSHCPEK